MWGAYVQTYTYKWIRITWQILANAVLDGWHDKCPSHLQWKLIQMHSSILWKECICLRNQSYDIRSNNNNITNSLNTCIFSVLTTDGKHSLFSWIFDQSNWLKHWGAQMVYLELFLFKFEMPLGSSLTYTFCARHKYSVCEPFNYPIFELNEYFYLTMHSHSSTSLHMKKIFLEMFRTGMMCMMCMSSKETKDA